MSSTNRTLPPKENALFKRILRCYEHKLYKNGLKFCKQILNNAAFADHAETLAMKGLILNALGRREEAYEYVRRGLRNDLKSHTCWHVYGLLQRSERKYDEAIKCYRNALKWDPNNIQILRELSIVQIHIRDLRGYRDTRNQLFNLKPGQRASWIGFAMSYHLLKDYEMAFKILENFRKTQNTRDTYDYENSELLLYQNNILEESGDLVSAIKHLMENKKHIYDKSTLTEITGKLHQQLGDFPQAVTAYKTLISINQDNVIYYRQLEQALQIENDPRAKLLLYKEYAEKFPRAFLPKRLPLDCTEGEEFLCYLRPYIISALTKGAPPLFTDLRPLYKDSKKVAAIQKLVESMVVQLIDNSRYSEEHDDDPAPASALLWTYYYLAQHYDYLGETTTALKYIDKAIEHTPTLIELFMCKGKIYKHAGDLLTAAVWMDEARDLDTADRYINSKSAKYHLRADHVDIATSVCGKFTREGTSAMDNLNEMQCMWFQTECALAYQRNKQWGEALKKCHEVDRHFTEIIDDQYDFHTYCLRKMTLRSYMQLLRLEDKIRAHPFYFKAAKCAIDVYIHLYDNPLQSKSTDEQISPDNLSPAELKKLKNKQRKARRKAELEQQAAAAAAEKKEQHAKSKQNSSEDGENHPPPSEELLPEKLASANEPLQTAIKFLQPLQSFASSSIETHLLAFEIYSRKDKPLLMLQSIKRAHKIQPDHPKLHKQLIRFHQTMASRVSGLPEPLPLFIKQEMDRIYGGKSLLEINAEYISVHSKSLPRVLAGTQMLNYLKPEEQNRAVQLVTALPKDMKDLSIATCGEILEALTDGSLGKVDSKIVSEFRDKCRSTYPYAKRFMDSADSTQHPPRIDSLKIENGGEC